MSIIILAKFTEGGWITLVIVPGLVLLLNRIQRHYQSVAKEVEEPLDFQAGKPRPSVVIPIDARNRATEKALRFGLLFSDDITALHIGAEMDEEKQLRELCAEKVEKPAERAGGTVPRLEVLDSPYRQIYQAILDFVERLKRQDPNRLIAVIIPEVLELHWYEHALLQPCMPGGYGRFSAESVTTARLSSTPLGT